MSSKGNFLFFSIFASLAFAPQAVEARVFVSLKEALSLSFPGCTTHEETIYLTEAQMKEASKLAGVDVDSALLVRYRADCPKIPKGKEGSESGFAYTDTHRVRTKAESLLVVIGTEVKTGESSIRKIEMLSFDEPQDYIPNSNWYATFEGQAMSAELEIKQKIPPVTGASLTARATVSAAKRVLSLHKVLGQKAKASQ